MSSDENALIVARNVGKAYPMYRSPADRLKNMLFPSPEGQKEYWALRDVNVVLRKGHTLGVIGRNGAGKSTLLQILCGTLSPTTGEIAIRGRISALLELGAGFNPDFTGRENVYLYASVLGLTRDEIDSRLPRILAFAEIREFIDLPVKTYSSGMFVRLAFSVAINVDPDILIVDEALSVGDARFQHRCMTRIRQMQESGVSIIYVSHDTESVKRLCNHVIVLHDGKIAMEGDPLTVANWYLAFAAVDFDLVRLEQGQQDAVARTAQQSTTIASAAGDTPTPSANPPTDAHIFDEAPEFKYFRYGDGTARLTHIYLTDVAQSQISTVTIGSVVDLHLKMEFFEDRLSYGVGFYIRDTLGTSIIGINTFQEAFTPRPVKASDRSHLRLRLPLDLKPGYYSISPSIAYHQDKSEWMDYIDNALIFRVVDPDLHRIVFGVYLPNSRSFEEMPMSESAPNALMKTASP